MQKKLVISIAVLILGSFQCALAQKEQTKNEFSFFYAPEFSKSNFDKTISEGGFGFNKEFYETVKPSKVLLGASYGVSYAREINQKSRITFLMERKRYGQSSPVAYNYRGFTPQDTLPNYGGLKYKLTQWSYAVTVNYSIVIHSKRNLESSVGLGIGVDFYDKAIIQDFIVQRKDGVIRPGCCTGHYTYLSTLQKLNGFWYPIKAGLYRGNLSMFYNLKYKILGRVSFHLTPRITYLTNIIGQKSSPPSFIPNGTVILVGGSTGVGLSF
ncbi:MAG: hypothetical protein R2792_04965 [Saprospiraceae bacterium]